MRSAAPPVRLTALTQTGWSGLLLASSRVRPRLSHRYASITLTTALPRREGAATARLLISNTCPTPSPSTNFLALAPELLIATPSPSSPDGLLTVSYLPPPAQQTHWSPGSIARKPPLSQILPFPLLPRSAEAIFLRIPTLPRRAIRLAALGPVPGQLARGRAFSHRCR